MSQRALGVLQGLLEAVGLPGSYAGPLWVVIKLGLLALALRAAWRWWRRRRRPRPAHLTFDDLPEHYHR